MPSEALDSALLDWWRDSKMYRPLVDDFPESGSREQLRLEALNTEVPTLGTSVTANVGAWHQANWLEHRTVLASFDLERALMRVPVTVLLADEPLACSEELLRDAEILTTVIEAEPVEDGMIHPGEAIIADLVATHGADDVAHLILQVSVRTTAANMLRLLGRAEKPSSYAVRRLAEHGLHSESVELRDAVVQALELWGDDQAVGLLSEHDEVVPWLADYIRRVLEDLRG